MSSSHSPLQLILKDESTLGNVELVMLGAQSECLCWTEVSWWLIYYTRTMLKNHHDVSALSSLTDDCQLRFKMFDEWGSLNRLIWSCNCMTILRVTNPNFGLAHKLSMIYLPHIWSCYQFGLRASPPIFYLSLCWCYHIWHKRLIVPPYPNIYLWREFISLFVCFVLFVMLRSPKSWGLLWGFW
jgi:hypothetical protein